MVQFIVFILVVSLLVVMSFILPVEYRFYPKGVVVWFVFLMMVKSLLNAAGKEPDHKVYERYQNEQNLINYEN